MRLRGYFECHVDDLTLTLADMPPNASHPRPYSTGPQRGMPRPLKIDLPRSRTSYLFVRKPLSIKSQKLSVAKLRD